MSLKGGQVVGFFVEHLAEGYKIILLASEKWFLY